MKLQTIKPFIPLMFLIAAFIIGSYQSMVFLIIGFILGIWFSPEYHKGMKMVQLVKNVRGFNTIK